MYLELTDGWYKINANPDDPLKKAILSRKIFIGQKLRIHGANV